MPITLIQCSECYESAHLGESSQRQSHKSNNIRMGLCQVGKGFSTIKITCMKAQDRRKCHATSRVYGPKRREAAEVTYR